MQTNRNRAALFLAFTLAAYLGLFYLTPRLPIRTGAAMLGALLFTTTVFMGVQISLIRWMADLRLRPILVLPAMLVCAGLFAAGFILIASTEHQRLLHLAKDPKLLGQLRSMKGFSAYATFFVAYRGPLVPIMNALLIATVGLFGYLVSFILRERNIILPISAVAAFTDFWTVSVGPTSHMLKKAPSVVQAVSAQIPTPGAGRIAPTSFIGPGDFLFLAMLFGAICRHGMNARRTFWFVYPLLTLGMLAVIFRLVDGFPALVLVALGVVLANFGQWKLSKSEEKAVMAVAGMLGLAALILTSVLTRR